MNDQWYYAKNKQKHGPMTLEDLKQLSESGKLLPTDLVWREGMDKWQPASTVKELQAAERKEQSPGKLAAQVIGGGLGGMYLVLVVLSNMGYSVPKELSYLPGVYYKAKPKRSRNERNIQSPS